MAQKQSTSLVPIKKETTSGKSKEKGAQPFTLFDGERHFTDREDVREFLPDILGKALARTWIDPEFRQAFDNDPCGTLETHSDFPTRKYVYRISTTKC